MYFEKIVFWKDGKHLFNRKNVNPNSSYLFICERHFEEKYLNKQNNQRVRLCNAKNPVPTIHPPSIVNTTPSVLPTLSTPRKPPKARVYRRWNQQRSIQIHGDCNFFRGQWVFTKIDGKWVIVFKKWRLRYFLQIWHKQYSCTQGMWND